MNIDNTVLGSIPNDHVIIISTLSFNLGNSLQRVNHNDLTVLLL